MKRQKEEEMYFCNKKKKKCKHQNKNIEPKNPQNYKEFNTNENYEQNRINPNEIPPEYRDIYMRQQMEQE